MPRTQLAEFMRRMEPDSVAIIPSARERVRSNDTEYRYRQDSDFFYLTGFNEPEAVAVIAPAREGQRFTLFVRPRDPERETWSGVRAGVEGACGRFGADAAYPIEELDERLKALVEPADALWYSVLGDGGEDLLVTNLERARNASAAAGRPHDLLTKLCYGSDWHMPDMVDGTRRYLDTFLAIMNRDAYRDRIDDFFWRNAYRYLGLPN